MKREHCFFIDPRTNSKLSLKVNLERDGEVISGSLFNSKHTYPIIKGIPRFVARSLYTEVSPSSQEMQTAASFGKKWREPRGQRIGAQKRDMEPLKEQLLAALGCSSAGELKRLFAKVKRTLNAGCGIAWSEYLFNHTLATQRYCIDISLAVETAYHNTLKFPNVSVAQASIFELPFPDNFFDIVYSIGVIHHTANPEKAFMSLVKKTAPGGLVGIYIYNHKPCLRELADKEIRRHTTAMSYKSCMRFARQMTQLAKSLNMISQPLIIPEDIKLLGIKKGEYSVQRFIYDYFLKCWYNPGQDDHYADLVNQDWYHPFYASHHSKQEVSAWAKAAGLKNIRCLQPRGWVQSGYFLSGRKA